MRYEEIASFTKTEIVAALDRANPAELKTMALSAALHVDDVDWAQAICLKLAAHPDAMVRGNAILAFGQLARIHGRLDREVEARRRILPAAEADGDGIEPIEDVRHPCARERQDVLVYVVLLMNGRHYESIDGGSKRAAVAIARKTAASLSRSCTCMKTS